MAITKTPVVVTPPTMWANAEAKLTAIETTAKTILSKVSPATLNTIAQEIESGVITTFPGLAAIAGDIGPFLAESEAISALIAQVETIKAVPVSQ